MRYYIIAGEASGDLHASHLMHSLKKSDADAQFRCFGGDLMAAEGGELVKHYRDMAYMGFVPVLLHLPTIMKNMRMCKRDISEWKPDVVILVDYPGFNLDIAKYAHRKGFKVFYYISPKIWAWKEWRIKQIKKYVDEMFSILPFEVAFYEGKHHYPIHYVGNPTESEVRAFRQSYTQSFSDFCASNGLEPDKPIVALLAGSRQQEIKDNLPAMIEATRSMEDYQFVLAGAPSITDDYYERFAQGSHVHLVKNATYPLLAHSTAALVTSGTATLETALFDVPQVVCYETPIPHIVRFAFKHIIKVRFISLVNLIADKEIVEEMLADRFSVENIRKELTAILPGGNRREKMLAEYDELDHRLGSDNAPDNAAKKMVEMVRK
ncbi:MAG: lipid-A-disaccharide synthase [Prevotella sp.]|nr:lipid-A-disaccharide synthase [Prevotella sp.]